MDSTAADPSSKDYAYEAGKRAVKEHYQRMGIETSVEMTERPGWYRSDVKIQDNPCLLYTSFHAVFLETRERYSGMRDCRKIFRL